MSRFSCLEDLELFCDLVADKRELCLGSWQDISIVVDTPGYVFDKKITLSSIDTNNTIHFYLQKNCGVHIKYPIGNKDNPFPQVVFHASEGSYCTFEEPCNIAHIIVKGIVYMHSAHNFVPKLASFYGPDIIIFNADLILHIPDEKEKTLKYSSLILDVDSSSSTIDEPEIYKDELEETSRTHTTNYNLLGDHFSPLSLYLDDIA